MFKKSIFIGLLVMCANNTMCMEGSNHRSAIIPDFLDLQLGPENVESLFLINKSASNLLFELEQSPEFFVLHYDDNAKHHQVFCNANRAKLARALISYHLLEARCSCAEKHRSFLSKKLFAECESQICVVNNLFSFFCQEKFCHTTIDSDTREKLTLKMILHQALNHGKHPDVQALIEKADSVITIQSDELVPKGSLCLLEPFGSLDSEQYIVFFGKSEKSVMQKYFKSKIESGSYNVDYLRMLLNQGTAGQQKVQRGVQSKLLICPTKGCRYKVQMQVVEDSFNPLLSELFRHFALCHLLSDTEQENYKIIAHRIGNNFLEARSKLG